MHCMLGGALLSSHQGEEAEQEFRLALQFGPSPDAYKGMVQALVMQGKLDEAIQLLNQALREEAGNAQYRDSLDRLIELKKGRPAGDTPLSAPQIR